MPESTMDMNWKKPMSALRPLASSHQWSAWSSDLSVASKDRTQVALANRHLAPHQMVPEQSPRS